MSSSTDASQEPAGLLPGSPRILSGSRTAALPNTGTCYKTRRPKPNRRAACRCLAMPSLPEPTHPLCGTERRAYSHSLAFFPQSELRPPAWGIGKSPLWAMAATSPALILQIVETENSHDPRANGVARFGNMNMNYSRPNESAQDVEISTPRAVQAARTVHFG